MFTGLVVERGRVAAPPAPSADGGRRLILAHSAALAERLEIGASLAVSGVCLTVTALEPAAESGPASPTTLTTVELSPETLRRTALGELAEGDRVNLEPALRMGDPLGGHWVQGHVDGLAEVVAVDEIGAHRQVTFSAAGELGRYLAEKGSVTLDGVSLTVAGEPVETAGAAGESAGETAGDPAVTFTVALIPHTLEATTLGDLELGSRVHLEVDVLAKYVERLLAGRRGGAEV